MPGALRQDGFTLVELLVAGTLMGIFGLLFASAGSTFFGAVTTLDARTANVGNAGVAQQRLLSDARGASSTLCSDADKVSFTIGSGMQTLVQYRVEDKKLLRWSFPPDRDSLVAQPVQSLACGSLGPDLTEIDLQMGSGNDRLRLAMTISEGSGGGSAGGDGSGGGGGDSGGGGKDKKKKDKKKKDKKKKKGKKKKDD